MATFPGVYIQELPSPVHTISAVATSIAAFVGYTPRGIDNRAQRIFSFSDFERLYGGLASNSELSYAVQQFFQNGGAQAYVVRTPATSLGAAGASVVFGSMQFTALGSGQWANGQLLIDVDVQGINLTTDPLAFNLTITDLADGTVESFPNVTLTQTNNNFIATVVNDPDHGSQLVKISFPGSVPTTASTVSGVVGGPLSIATLDILMGGSLASVPGTVAVTNGQPVVNGTGTKFQTGTPALAGGQWLVFASDSTQTWYQIKNITNDSQLTLASNFAGTTAGSSAIAVVGTIPGTVAVTNGSVKVTGSGFNTNLKVGQYLIFGSDLTRTYQIVSIADDNDLTLSAKFAGATGNTGAALSGTTASADFSLKMSTASPATPPSPMPIDNIKIFGKGSAIPQTLTGLVAHVQQAINAVLAIQMPGASVQCSVAPVTGGQAIRVNALLPQNPDALVTFSAPGTGSDAAAALALESPSVVNVAHYTLGSANAGTVGFQTSSTKGSDGAGAGSNPALPQTADIVGDPAAFTGIYALQKVDLFNLLCIPDATRALPSNPGSPDTSVSTTSIYNAAITLCDQRRAFLLVDPPPNVSTVSTAVDWISSQLGMTDPNGAAFFPRLRLPDPLNNFQLRTFAPSGVVAGVYAKTDGSRGIWKAPAGIEAVLNGVQSMVYKLNDPENGVLNPLGLNCFRTFPVYGPVLWGARTLAGADVLASQWKYVPIRRTALFLEESLYRGTQWVVFEPNDERLWAAIRLNIGSFMQTYFLKGAFKGQTPDQAYFVKCDSETTTQTDIDNGVVNILVGFAPLFPAEFVVIRIEQLTGQAQA